MKSFFQTLFKITAYTASALLILMAVGVGLFRLFLPRLPEYQEAIKERASEAIGMEVEFLSMNARWGLSGPELEFYEAELIRRHNQSPLIAADRVSVGISINSLVFDQEFVVDRILIRNTSIEIRKSSSCNLATSNQEHLTFVVPWSVSTNVVSPLTQISGCRATLGDRPRYRQHSCSEFPRNGAAGM
jgi:uncharacterized protein YhdP